LLELPLGANGHDALRISTITVLVLIISCIIWAVASIAARTIARPESPLVWSGMQMICGGIAHSLTAFATGEFHRIPWTNLPLRNVWSLAYLVVFAWSARPATQVAPPHRAAAPAGPTFVGAVTCQSCHRQEHDTWKSGRHSRMLQPATAASVKGDFSKETITLKGQRYRLRAAGGEYFITESFLTGKPQEHKIEYTLGSRRIQHFLTTIENGWMVILPPSWDVQRQEWFDNMEIVRPDERVEKLVQLWNRNCVGCHVS